MNYLILEKWSKIPLSNLIISKILKYHDQIAFFFRNSSKFLQINFQPSNSFCFLTNKKVIDFKDELKNFSSLLKNYKIISETILPDDRILKFELIYTDIFNKNNKLYLFLEFIPYFPNMIVTDENLIIKESLKKITPAQNQKRIIYPGYKYLYPEFKIDNKILAFPIKIDNNFSIDKLPEDINAFLENYFYNVLYKKFIDNQVQEKIKKLKRKLKIKENKLSKLYLQLSDYQKVNQWRMYLELLKGEYNKIKKGMNEIKLINYFDENLSEITIPLKPQFTASENIKYYAKKYRKALSGKEKIEKQIEITEKEIRNIKEQIENIKPDTLVNEEKRKEKNKSYPYKRIEIDDNWEIIFGRNKKENDFITTKVAKPYDWWFHTRIFHGTHLILRNLKKRKEIPPKLIEICASLAAYHSNAKKSKNIPVDYTQKKFVRKPKGSLPGVVTYFRHKTIYVNPMNEKEIVALLKKNERLS